VWIFLSLFVSLSLSLCLLIFISRDWFLSLPLLVFYISLCLSVVICLILFFTIDPLLSVLCFSLCPLCSIECQDYFRAVWLAYSQSSARSLGAKLIIIGCGTPKLGRALAEDIGAFGSPDFSIYVDPQREAYKALGLIAAAECPSLRHILKNAWLMVQQGLSRCWCPCQSGDPTQNGGAFVIEGSTGKTLFAKIDERSNDHAKIEDLLKAATVTTAPAATSA